MSTPAASVDAGQHIAEQIATRRYHGVQYYGTVRTFHLHHSSIISWGLELIVSDAAHARGIERLGELPEPVWEHRSLSSDDHRQVSRPPRVSVVIPTKNEAMNVGWVLERLGPEVDEVIIVDGLSDDGTVEVALAVRPDAVIVQHPVPGKGAAVRAGFDRASGEFVILIDADGSMDPAEIPAFVAALATGSDLVKGSRFIAGGGTADITRLRAVGNAVLTDLSNLLLATSYSELCYGYMGLRRSRINDLALHADGFEIETEIVVKACRAGLVVSEIPSFESARRYGASNLNTFRDGWRVLRTLFRERFASRPQVAAQHAPKSTIESSLGEGS